MKWITAADITNWANTQQRHCQGTLPELVGRLILAHSAGAVEEFDFPSGDSVTIGGWDGRLRTPATSPFFPSGSSGWEIGADKSAQTKAEGDHNARVADPLGLVPADTTFVFVTPRSFPKRSSWQNGKKALGNWKDVKVIAADVLEQWISITPAVGLWLARQIGKVVSGGIRDLEAAWEEWSTGTAPQMTPDLVIAGRLRDAQEIQGWVAGGPSLKEVQGDHPDEALAFLFAAIATLPSTPAREQALARCVVVENKSEMRQLVQAFPNYPLIIAGSGECLDSAPFAVSKGHHVFICMDATVIGIRNVLRLARPQRDIIESLLHTGGLSEADAQRAARDSGHSIPVLRRHLFQANAVSAPAWAKAESARVLLPVLLANAWDERKEGDREVMEAISGMSYDVFIRELNPFALIDDAPVRHVGSVWMIKSPLDAWYLLAPHLTQDQLRRYDTALLAVLTKTDPKYELDPDKRWAAAIYGKSNPYSEWLRTGLVESLVLIALYGSHLVNPASTQAFAERVVRDIFVNAATWEAWASIKDSTALLAEAAPDMFMEVVEQQLVKDRTVFEDLMRDDQGGIFDECRHCGLLWALEAIAWSGDYFGRAVKTLARLASIDPGGRWSNRPINSLSEIFHPMLPQTHAEPKDRLSALEQVIAEYPELAWKFAERYYGDSSMSESHRFRWRETGGTRRGLERESNERTREYVTGLLPILKDLACSRGNLVAALGDFIRLPSDVREQLLATIEAVDPATVSKEQRDTLLQETRAALNWINSFGHAEFGIYVPALNRVLQRFAPTDVIERVGWVLSTPWPRLPQGESREYDAKDTAVKAAQKAAAREVLDNASMEQIFTFASTIQYQGILGSAIATAIRDEEENNAVLDMFLTRAEDLPVLVRGYAFGRVETEGAQWVPREVQRLRTQGNYSPKACALLYLALPENGETWAAVEAEGEAEEAAYWRYANGRSQRDKPGDTAIAVEKLLNVQRPAIALEVAGSPHVMDIPSKLLQRLLQELLTAQDKNLRLGGMEEFHLGHVFNQLYQRNELPIEEIAKLEWPYAALFEDLRRYTSAPMALHRVLKNDPGFFAQLVNFMYRRDDRQDDSNDEGLTDEIRERRARVAHHVLDTWYLVPGVKEDGSLDERELAEWIEAARRHCQAAKRLIGCDLQIGFILAHAPADPDGVWPHIAVRNVLERLNNQTIDDHIKTELYNSRGMVSRDINAGGAQERDLARKYKGMSDALKAKWPRASAILRGMAEWYGHEAQGHDVEADLQELRWD